jgi:signal transduction histidine kinase
VAAIRQEKIGPFSKGGAMMKTLAFVFAVALSIMVMAGAGTAVAQDFGTAVQAKAMLEKAVAAVKTDKAKALTMFAKGEGGFKDRDLYPFCGGPDGKFTAHPTLTGQSLKDLKDKAGKPLGEEIYKVAQEGKISEVSYMWPRPGSDNPVQKVTFVTKAGDQVCAVGYYK